MIPRLLTATFLILSQGPAFAVSPLVTDDADTVKPGRLQLNGGWQLGRTGSESLLSLPINPALGLNSRGELGATFGYQWRGGSTEADGITDLAIATKWQLWQTPDEKFKMSARFDLKVPTASEDSGLGTSWTQVLCSSRLESGDEHLSIGTSATPRLICRAQCLAMIIGFWVRPCANN